VVFGKRFSENEDSPRAARTGEMDDDARLEAVRLADLCRSSRSEVAVSIRPVMAQAVGSERPVDNG
jgi:hypothetical protein